MWSEFEEHCEELADLVIAEREYGSLITQNFSKILFTEAALAVFSESENPWVRAGVAANLRTGDDQDKKPNGL